MGSKSEEIWVNEETLPSASDKLIKKSRETPFVPIGTFNILVFNTTILILAPLKVQHAIASANSARTVGKFMMMQSAGG